MIETSPLSPAPEPFPGIVFEHEQDSSLGTITVYYHGHLSPEALRQHELLPDHAQLTHTTDADGKPITKIEYSAFDPTLPLNDSLSLSEGIENFT